MKVSHIVVGHPWKLSQAISIYESADGSGKRYIAMSMVWRLVGSVGKSLKDYTVSRGDLGLSVGDQPKRVQSFIEVDSALRELLLAEYGWTDDTIRAAMKYFEGGDDEEEEEVVNIRIPLAGENPLQAEVKRHAKRIAAELRESIFADPVLIKRYKAELRDHIWSSQVNVAEILEELRKE